MVKHQHCCAVEVDFAVGVGGRWGCMRQRWKMWGGAYRGCYCRKEVEEEVEEHLSAAGADQGGD